jgi:hypothetical protein
MKKTRKTIILIIIIILTFSVKIYLIKVKTKTMKALASLNKLTSINLKKT